MKDHETVQRFIELRAQGLSFARIAQELAVSKNTLIEWSRSHQFEIQNLRSIETELLAERCFASRQQRWESLARHLARLDEELAKRDLSQVPTARLFHLASLLRAEVHRETAPLRFSSSALDVREKARYEKILDWQS